jgi:hypothetical protein
MSAASVTNDEFLHAVFGEASDNRPVIVSFPGDPGAVPGSAWSGTDWGGASELRADANNYFSLASFRPDEAGRYRRQKTWFAGLYAVLFDDIGGKVPEERVTLPPSWVLETSPGNFQYGFLLREPLADGALADRLMNAVIAMGLTDPGASGPRTRLARLPVGTNGKKKQQFPCRLAEWTPELRYSVEELTAGLELDMVASPKERKRTPRSAPGRERPADGDPVWTPRPTENAVLVALRARGLYKADLGTGKHGVTCPWFSEHTGAVDAGTAYFEPSDSYPLGGFKCLHGHCASHHISDLLTFLGIERSAARMSPTIKVVGGEMDAIVAAAEYELAQTKKYYQRSGLIVSVVNDPGTHETRVQDISQNALARALASIATWEKYDERTSGWRKTDPPQRHVAVLWDSLKYPHLPVLNGIARQPYLRPDGSLVHTPGYDDATGLFGAFLAGVFSVPTMPTRSDAGTALTLLKDLLAEFSFRDETDLAAALAAMLTAAIRPSLNTAPMFHVQAHTAGSGKSYLCELITAFATPQRGTPTTFPDNDEEMRKKLLASLLTAPAAITFDNLSTDLLAHDSLCSVLSSDRFEERILGISKTAKVSTRVLFLSSGNNVGAVGDMTRRTIQITLEPLFENPSERKFSRPSLVEEVLAARGRYVSAALTVILAWLGAGSPKVDVPPLNGFSGWSDWCRQPLLWLGCADPTESVRVAMSNDPDKELLGRLLETWFRLFGKRPTMLREVIQKTEFPDGDDELSEVVTEIASVRGVLNNKIFAWWIRKHAGRIVNGHRLTHGEGSRGVVSWQVQQL